LKITNTLTGRKEEFAPLEQGTVRLYVCGVTPYDDSHIGHGRCYVTFDLLYRLLLFLGYKISYCRNFTDIDDKLIKKAEKQFGDRLRYVEIAQHFIERFHENMDALGCLRPTVEPRVTQNMPIILDFIQKLIERGYAYEVNGDVYYHVSKFSGYPKLSKHNVEDLRVGARIEVSEQKKDPLDFALWKGEPKGEFFQSPWGWGRPGWHIECSALAAHYLGSNIDIHGGGMDLIFPHHDNEIAQSEAIYGAPFVRYWMHNGLINFGQEKMSKSLGNVFILHDLFAQYDPMIVRFYLLSHSYRSPLEFSIEGLENAQKSYARLCRQFDGDTMQVDSEQMKKSPTVQAMLTHLLDDMNAPGAFGALFERLATIAADEQERIATRSFIQQIFGLLLVPVPEKEVAVTPEIETLMRERDEARAQKDWARADKIREKLRQLGVDVQDKKS